LARNEKNTLYIWNICHNRSQFTHWITHKHECVKDRKNLHVLP
jgi:hypothetical protein